MAPTKVLIVGAAGQTGSNITEALLASPSLFSVSALVRPASAKKQANIDLEKRGVNILLGSAEGDVNELTRLLQGQEIVISVVSAMQLDKQFNLVTAAKNVNVKRFIPCGWMTVMPVGISWLRDEKEKVNNYVKQLGIPYTMIDVGWWFQVSFPRVPSGRLHYATPPFQTPLVGDGNKRSALTDLKTIGSFVAKIILDDRTLNRYVMMYDTLMSQNEIYELLEELSGEKIDRTYINEEELLAQIDTVKKSFKGPIRDSITSVGELGGLQYFYSWGIRGDNTPEYGKYLGYLVANELYPEVEKSDYHEFLKLVLDGKGTAAYSAYDN